jgi:hypothetical protein
MFAFLGLGRSGPAAAARGAPSSQPPTEALPSPHRPALSRVASPAASPRRSSLARPPLNSPAASPLRSTLAPSPHSSPRHGTLRPRSPGGGLPPVPSPSRSSLEPAPHSSQRLDTLRPRSPGGGLSPVPSPLRASLEPAPQRTTPAPAAAPAAAPAEAPPAPADVRCSFEVVDALFRKVVDRPDDLPVGPWESFEHARAALQQWASSKGFKLVKPATGTGATYTARSAGRRSSRLDTSPAA